MTVRCESCNKPGTSFCGPCRAVCTCAECRIERDRAACAARAADQERHDALVRTIAHRLPACTEVELRDIDAVLVRLERVRYLRAEGERTSLEHGAHAAVEAIERGLRELRDARAISLTPTADVDPLFDVGGES